MKPIRVDLTIENKDFIMKPFQLSSNSLSQKALLCCLSISVAMPVVLPFAILGTAYPVQAQGVLLARGGAGKAARILPKMLDMLTAAFGFGAAVAEPLLQPAPRNSLTQRQIYLLEGVRYQQYLFYQNSGGYLIPLSIKNLNSVMVLVGANSNEAEFVATAMHYFGSR